MMVSPISAVRFSGASPLDREGAFSKPKAESFADEPVKKKSKGKKLLKTVGFLAVVAGALAGLNKFGITKVLESGALKDAKLLEKVSHYAAKAGEAVLKYTWEPLAKLFAKK